MHTLRVTGDPFPRARDGNLVVTYHYVRPANSPGVTGITPDAFESQLRDIRANYEVVTAEEFAALAPTRPGLALITFDDALLDQYIYAAPILERLAVPAVFFAPMRPFAGLRDGWTTQHLLHALADRFGFGELERLVMPHVRDIRIDREQVDDLYAYELPEKRTLKWLMAFALAPDRARKILSGINEYVGLMHTSWFMSREQLLHLQHLGHSIGGHGFEHAPYATLTPKQQCADMHLAQYWMSRLFGHMPRQVAYPFGSFDDTTEVLARSAGYTYAHTTSNRTDAKNLGLRPAQAA